MSSLSEQLLRDIEVRDFSRFEVPKKDFISSNLCLWADIANQLKFSVQSHPWRRIGRSSRRWINIRRRRTD